MYLFNLSLKLKYLNTLKCIHICILEPSSRSRSAEKKADEERRAKRDIERNEERAKREEERIQERAKREQDRIEVLQ
jgi:hypothetical protein